MGGARVMTKAVSSSSPPNGASTSIEALKLLGMSGESPRKGSRPHVESPRAKRPRTDADNNGNGAHHTQAEVELVIDNVCSDDWQQRLEELQRLRPHRSRAPLPTDALMPPPTEAELLALARKACSKGTEANWEALTFPAKAPRPAVVGAVVRLLNGPEAVAVLSTCAARFRLHPRERALCAIWILQVIETRGSILVGRRELDDALRDLLQFLEPRPGELPLSSQVRSCLGSWRLTTALAKKHRHSRSISKPVAVASSKPAAGTAKAASSEEEASSEEDNGEDEDGAPAAGEASDDE